MKKNLDRWIGLAVFAIGFACYALTAQRSTGFWDCGEFIASTFKLQVSHPPGAPLYTLLSRVFVSVFPVESVAFASSLFSALFGALTGMVLYHIIRKTLQISIQDSDSEISLSARIAAVIGSLSLVFAHSFWTASTEAEVYSLSTFLIALVLWIMLKWKVASDAMKPRWLLLAALVTGLSASVHIMSIAVVIPAAFLFWLEGRESDLKNLAIASLLGVGAFTVAHNVLFKWPVAWAEKFELMLVNDLGLPVHSGVWLMLILIAVILASGILVAGRRSKKALQLGLLCAAFYCIGLTPYSMVFIRSQVATPISNDASDITRFLSYIETEQYSGFADRPFLKGRFFDSVLDGKKPYKPGKPVHVLNEEKTGYVMTNAMKKGLRNYAKGNEILFSRMYSPDPADKQAYFDWVNITGDKIKFYNAAGEPQKSIKPDMASNLAFFFKFQLGWLNLRYLLANYSGVQNDAKGIGDGLTGNWLSGIPTFDESRIGDQELPSSSDRSRNVFFMVPFLIGLLGFYVLLKKGTPLFWSLLVAFLAFGLAITIFMNQIPHVIVVRERDYVFLGMYLAFSAFLGIGVHGLLNWLSSKFGKAAFAVGSLVLFLLIPGSMALQGWDDHNRSITSFPEELAKAYLSSCPDNAILITAGDNVTMPIWYVQEVLGFRTDVRVIDYELLSQDWFIDRLQRKINQSDPIKLSINRPDYAKGRLDEIPFVDQNVAKRPIELAGVVDFVTDAEKQIKHNRGQVNYFPTDVFRLTTNPENPDSSNTLDWTYSKASYFKSDLVLMGILQNNFGKRPVCFSYTGNSEHFINLQDHFIQKGIVFELNTPAVVQQNSRTHQVDLTSTLDLFENTFEIRPLNESTHHVQYIDGSISELVLRRMYSNLANALAQEQKAEKAIEVLAQCEALLPNETVPHGELSVPMVVAYFEIGQTDAGLELTKTIMSNLKGENELMFSHGPSHYAIQKRRIQANMQAYYNTLSAVSPYIKKKFGQSSELEFGKMVESFDQWMAKHEPD